jgi:hypothetical protein
VSVVDRDFFFLRFLNKCLIIVCLFCVLSFMLCFFIFCVFFYILCLVIVLLCFFVLFSTKTPGTEDWKQEGSGSWVWLRPDDGIPEMEEVLIFFKIFMNFSATNKTKKQKKKKRWFFLFCLAGKDFDFDLNSFFANELQLLTPADLDMHLSLECEFSLDEFIGALTGLGIDVDHVVRQGWRYALVLDLWSETGPFCMDLIEPQGRNNNTVQ